MTMPDPRQIRDDIALCLVFFTRLPLPHLDFGNRRLADSIWAAPLAGLAVGLIGALAYAIADWLGLSPQIAAALALTATMLTTGCLHEDGLSDTADGFGGGRTRERKLEIMRDSRIGAYGASALILSALLRWSAIAELQDPSAVFLGLVAAHVAARAIIPAFMHIMPPARADGLAAGAGIVSRETATVAAAIGVVALLLLGLSAAVIAILLLGCVLALLCRLCQNQIGGQTGDTIGALQQVCEISVLLVAAVALS